MLELLSGLPTNIHEAVVWVFCLMFLLIAGYAAKKLSKLDELSESVALLNKGIADILNHIENHDRELKETQSTISALKERIIVLEASGSRPSRRRQPIQEN